MAQLGLIAKYPVLPEARDWLAREGPKLDDLLTDFLYARARDAARERVWASTEARKNDRTALPGPGGNPAPPSAQEEDPFLRPPGSLYGNDVGEQALMAATQASDSAFLTDVDAEMELVSHPLSRMLVAAVGHDFLTRRFAVAESKRMSALLAKEPGETITAVAQGLDVAYQRRDDAGDGRTFGVHFTRFLATAPPEKTWRLVWRDPEKGFVWMDKKDFVRYLEAAYKAKLEAELKGREGNVPGAVREVFASDIARLKSDMERRAEKYREAKFTEIDQERFPPCMNRILQDMHNHVNIPHMGRFAIVTFLHTLGMDANQILKFFSSVPDFDPDKSRYQIEHITGKGGPTEYTPPGCSTMQTHGVCPLEERTKTCEFVKHPLGYYRREMWFKEKMKQRRGNGAGAKNATNGGAKDKDVSSEQPSSAKGTGAAA